jgi:hypothetical protein
LQLTPEARGALFRFAETEARKELRLRLAQDFIAATPAFLLPLGAGTGRQPERNMRQAVRLAEARREREAIGVDGLPEHARHLSAVVVVKVRSCHPWYIW